jgi:glycosyltransferase involved in cell wall biosynthesis
MRIAWFTPFGITSAIGRASKNITDQLGRRAEVHIWHPEDTKLHPSQLRLIGYSPSLDFDPSMLDGYDLAVYNLGNYLPFHRQIFEIARKAPGLVILHDFVMHHFFAAYYLEHLQDPERYRDAVVRYYGEFGARVTDDSRAGRRPWIWETDDVGDIPLFEEATRGAWGVVVHSEFFRERVSTVFPGPVRKLGLAYSLEAPARAARRGDLNIPAGRIMIVTIGHVNPNKRIHSVLEVLARRPDLKEAVYYVVIGPCDESYRLRLDQLAAASNLDGSLHFTGYASDELLKSYLALSDICINLRHPFTEGASASAIEEMLYGKAVVVTNAGFFRELPDDCVRKVEAATEVEDLERAIEELVSDSRARRALGDHARTYAESHFRADDYASGILDFCNELLAAKPILQHTDRVGSILAEMGVTADMPVVDTAARICSQMFCGENAVDKGPER